MAVSARPMRMSQKISMIRILAVEDFTPWQRVIVRILESQNDFEVISVVADGKEAVQKAKELQPDVILMDVGLPGIDGFEATQRIRIVSPGSKILFLSTIGSPKFVEKAFSLGASGYVLKHDSNSDLVSSVRTVLLDQYFISRTLTNRREGFFPGL